MPWYCNKQNTDPIIVNIHKSKWEKDLHAIKFPKLEKDFSKINRMWPLYKEMKLHRATFSILKI